MPLRTINLTRFLREIRDRHTLQKARPFCFILGAGASFESDIPTGATLVDRWLADMHRDEAPAGITVEKWATAEILGVKAFAYECRAQHYGKIYSRRFEGTPDTGHAELQSLLSGKEPSFGYSILAYLLAHTQHKAVITTNFDNLVADALYLYSNTAPILCVHESLASFITAQLDRPLVVKIHRDLLLSPRNADDEIDALDRAWNAPLRSLFSHFTPIFIGYGGNDGSLMGFLEKLEPTVPDRLYWCVRACTPPNERVKQLLDRRSGTLVEIPGFDSFMLLLKQALEIPDLLPVLEQRHRARTDRYNHQLAALTKASLDQASTPQATEQQRAVADAAVEAVQQAPKEDTPSSLILHAQCEPDADKAKALFRAALEKHPENGDLMGAYAEFLAAKRQRFDEAEVLHRRALELDPDNPSRQNEYGAFLWHSRGDGQRAESLLRQAIATRQSLLGPEHPETLMVRHNLAAALGAQGKVSKAVSEYRAVLAARERVLGSEHPDTLVSRSNLAAYLHEQGQDTAAEEEHRAVLAVRERVQGREHPDVAASCQNLAEVLCGRSMFTEARELAERAREIWRRTYGDEHRFFVSAERLCQRIEAAQAANQEEG